MSTFKQQAKLTVILLIAVAGMCVAGFFALDWAGIHAPGPDAIAGTESESDANPSATPSAGDAVESAKQIAVGGDSKLQLAFGTTASPKAAAQASPGQKVLITTSVRTTAYTHTEADHIKYGKATALGTDLRYTPEYHSVAADWSRFPLGTKFRMKGVDRLFVVDDYGKALVGSRTVDIYFPSKKQMNHWGVRHVDIDVVEFGNFHESRKILAARANYDHCREMLASMTSDNWWKNYK